MEVTMFRRLSDVLRPRDRRDAEAGFTVIEVMVAMMVFAVMSVGIAYGIVNALQLSQGNRGRETAISLASQDLDAMRQVAAQASTGIQNVTSATTTKTIGGVTYTVARTANWVDANGTLSTCGTSNGALAYKNVQETVTWAGAHGGRLSTTMTSSIAPDSAVSDPGDGTITISVITASGAPNANVTITVTPVAGGGGAALSAQPAVTNAQGCSVAYDVDPGTYTVTASESGGIDSNQLNPSSQSPVTVVASAAAYVPFVYDQAATLNLQYAQSYGATLPASMPTTLYSTGGGYDSMSPWGTSPTVTSSTTTAMSVFPYSAYYVTAGNYSTASGSAGCLSPNPGAWTTPNTAAVTGVAPQPIGTSPGTSTATTNVMMGVVQITGLSGQYVVATTTTAGSGDPGCAAGMTLRFPKATAASMTYALPFGTWTINTATSLTGAVGSLLLGSTVKAVTPGSVSGSTTAGWTVVMDPRGQTK
jgi:prepilin-type N-terminal cleavage/methylation domain-containing protein